MSLSITLGYSEWYRVLYSIRSNTILEILEKRVEGYKMYCGYARIINDNQEMTHLLNKLTTNLKL